MDDFYFFCDFNILKIKTKTDGFNDKHRAIDGKLQWPEVSCVEPGGGADESSCPTLWFLITEQSTDNKDVRTRTIFRRQRFFCLRVKDDAFLIRV
jgi:hypothetical protein